ncbi:MAR-binding filament-like protein 1-1 [Sesamum alatum]|uniref:MAR-binding filament-like protein 1-1 n=1 Tax=Sesamum alatum TaxID=300844 RepID=A0AAE2CMD1_9LAMI|nr:MAR-binding filament-like protein 1-1 [Sesamum alatum]
MNIELKEKEEAAIASVQRKFETELLNEIDARNKAVEKANRERQSLVDRLNLARNVITRMGKALENEKSLYKELATQAHDLENGLEEAENEKRELQKELKEKLHSLAVLQEKINLLSSEIKDPSAEKDQRSTQKEYDEFKSSMEKKSASDVKLLGEKEAKIHRLEEQLQLSSMELSISKVLISDLTMEKDSLNETLNVESGNVENLSRELKITQDALQKSRGEASDLAEQLQQSRYLCLGLEAEIGKVHDQFTEVTELLQKNNDEAKQRVMILAGELRLATELLSKSSEKLETTAQELAAAVQKCDSLEKEVTGAHEKAESAALALQQEKMIISCLNKDLMALETQISNDMEARKRLEEAAKSVDEMNEYALIISKELELANSQILSLEDEKDELYRSLVQQKAAYQEARDLIMRLGKERESLQKRGEKLEQVLASAKGEILRLRRQINDDQKQKPVDVRDKADGKVTPRKKVNPQQEDE